MYNVLIIGGGVAGLSSALIFGSAYTRDFMKNKKVGIIAHQKASSLQNAVFNNVLGLPIGKTGQDILVEGREQLTKLYPNIEQIEGEMVMEVKRLEDNNLEVITNKNVYLTQNIIVCTGAKRMAIKGLLEYKTLHTKLPLEKERIMFKHKDYKVTDGIYVAGTLAGERSQFAIAAGSGTTVATDILTLWNGGKTTMIHDKI